MARALGAMPASEGDNAEQLWQKENVVAVLECAGASATVNLALQAAPRGARLVLLGLSSLPAGFIPMRLVREGIDIRTSMIYDHPKDFAGQSGPPVSRHLLGGRYRQRRWVGLYVRLVALVAVVFHQRRSHHLRLFF